jgi:hypothetical protein
MLTYSVLIIRGYEMPAYGSVSLNREKWMYRVVQKYVRYSVITSWIYKKILSK